MSCSVLETHNPAQAVPAISLRGYQFATLDAIEAAEARGQRRQLVALPTGTGKTVIFCELIRRRHDGRTLILVHRDELRQQTLDKLALIAPDLSVGVVKASEDEHTAQVVVASIQTLSRESRLRRVQTDFSTVIVDEAHHAPADTYQRVLDHFRCGEPDGPLLVGFTATPYRADGESLIELFESIVSQRTILEMIREGYLSDLTALRVRLAVNFDELHTRAGDFIDSESADLLRAGNAPALLADAYLEHARARRGLVFVPTVALAEEFASAFLARGIVTESLSGDTPMDTRRDLLRRFHEGQVQVITNCGVLVEGYDEPSVDCIVVARPTKSKTLYVQMIGRGTRRFPGKADCLILDVAGATERHDLMSLASVFELPPARLRNGASVIEAVDAYQHDCRLEAVVQADAARVVTHTVNLFRARPLNWVVVGADHFVLPVGDHGMLHVRPAGHTWRAMLYRPDGGSERITDRFNMDYTIGAAEDFARTLGADKLLARDAPWRLGQATDKQRDALRRLRMEASPSLTRGEASDLIAASVARRFA